MNQVSKLINNSGKVVVLAALIAGVAIVQPAAAAGCGNATTLISQSVTNISSKTSAMSGDFSARLTKIGTDIDALDKKISDARAAATTAFEGKITDLESTENLSADQKTAIEQYKTDMETAEKTRETAVDAARTTYRSGLSDALKTYQANITSAAGAFKDTMSSLSSYANKNCGASGKSDSWYTQTIAYVKTDTTKAKATYAAARATNSVNGTVATLKSTRDQAIAAANQAFTDTSKQATTTLSTALGATQNTATDQSQSGTGTTGSGSGSGSGSGQTNATTPTNTDSITK
jgi:hypothetical protein